MRRPANRHRAMRVWDCARGGLSVAAMLLLPQSELLGADTWTNGTSSRLWSTGGNWQDTNEPTGTDDVTFPNPIPPAAGSDSVLLSAGEVARSVIFNAPYTLTPNVGGASLLLTTGVATVASGQSAIIAVNLNGINGLIASGTLTLTATNTYSGTTTVNTGTLQIGNGATTGSIPGDATVNNLCTLAFNHSDSRVFTGVISGAGNVTKLGTNLLALTANQAYLGVTTISGGTLQLGNAGTSGTVGGDIVNNAALTFNRLDDFAYGGAISGSGAMSKLQSNTLTLTGNNTYAGVTTIATGGTIQIGAGSTTGAITGNVTNNGTLTFNRSNDVTYGGVISGAGQVVKLAANKLTLTGNNTPGFGMTISAGTLELGIGGTSGSMDTNIVNNGTLIYNRSDNITPQSVISGSGQVIKLGSNTLTLTADNTYSGDTTISGGTLQLGNGGTGAVAGNIVNNGAVIYNNGPGTRTYAGAISGSGGVTKLAGNTLILTGNHTYAGGTTISGGTLQIGNGGATGFIPGNVANSGTLGFNRSDDITFGGLVSGSGGLNKFGAGAVVLTANQTYTGGTFIDAGTLQLGNGGTTGALASGSNITTNGTLAFNRSDDITFDGSISGTGGLLKLGPNTLTLPFDYSYMGVTTISAGTLRLGTGGFSGSVAGNIVDNGALVFNHTGVQTFVGAISGSGNVTKSGSNLLFLTANNTYGGMTTIAGGTLSIGNGGASGTIVGNVVTSGALRFDSSTNLTFAGAISGSGGLEKLAGNTLTLTGNHTYTGFTSISGGMLVLTKPYTSGSGMFIANGTIARLAHSGTTPNNVVLKTGLINTNISGKLDVFDNKLIVATGVVGSWNGSNYTGLTGLIQSGRGDGSWNGNGVVTSMSDATSGVLTTLAIGEAGELGYAGGTFGGVPVSNGDALVMYTWGGDADLNGQLNGDDYFFIDSNVLQSGSVFGFHNGDFNYDGTLNGDDYFILDSNILQAQASGIVWPTGAGVGGLASVPEPTGFGAAIAALTILTRRRLRPRRR